MNAARRFWYGTSMQVVEMTGICKTHEVDVFGDFIDILNASDTLEFLKMEAGPEEEEENHRCDCHQNLFECVGTFGFVRTSMVMSTLDRWHPRSSRKTIMLYSCDEVGSNSGFCELGGEGCDNSYDSLANSQRPDCRR